MHSRKTFLQSTSNMILSILCMYTVYRDHITNKLDFMVKCTQAQCGQPSVNPHLKICRSTVRKQWRVAHLDFGDPGWTWCMEWGWTLAVHSVAFTQIPFYFVWWIFSVLYYLNYKLNTKSVLRIKSVVIGLRILNLTFFFLLLYWLLFCAALLLSR